MVCGCQKAKTERKKISVMWCFSENGKTTKAIIVITTIEYKNRENILYHYRHANCALWLLSLRRSYNVAAGYYAIVFHLIPYLFCTYSGCWCIVILHYNRKGEIEKKWVHFTLIIISFHHSSLYACTFEILCSQNCILYA